MAIKTVQDLIDQLNAVKDKTKPVFGYIVNEITEETDEIVTITLVDEISDRVDINLSITD